MDHCRRPMGRCAIFVFLVFSGAWAQESLEPRLGQVQVDEARIFVMEAETQDATLPMRLSREAVVVVVARGESFRGTGTHFYQVGLPGGVQGYVFAQYVDQRGDGWGEISGSRVMLRPNPTNQERLQPIATLQRGDRVRLIGRKGDWWEVRSEESTLVWMRAEDLRIIGPLEAHAGSVAEARARALAGWRAQVEAAKQEAAFRKQHSQALAEIEKIRAIYRTQVGRDAQEVNLIESREALEATRKGLADFRGAWSAELISTLGLEGNLNAIELGLDEWRIRLDLARAEQEKEPEPEVADPVSDPVPARPAAPVEWWKEAYLGHLERLADPHYETRFALVRGGQVIAHLRCRTGRYELTDFQGCWVLVRGEASQPPSLAGRKLVDISRLKVLATPF